MSGKVACRQAKIHFNGGFAQLRGPVHEYQ